mgnify:CR=1 FL=1
MEAINSGKEVVVVLDSGGDIVANELQLSNGQQLLGAGSTGSVTVVFQDGHSTTIDSLGGRPEIRNDLSGITISINDNNRIEGISIVTTSEEPGDPSITGSDISNITLHDLIIESGNRGISLTNVANLTVSNCSITAFSNSITINAPQGQTNLSNISSDSPDSGKIAINNNGGELTLSDIYLNLSLIHI